MLTYADYCRWPEGKRWELINGQALAIAPAPSRLHQEFVVELAAQIHPQLAGSPCCFYVVPFDLCLPCVQKTDDQIDTLVQPDLAVICDPSKLDDTGCRGAPDWLPRFSPLERSARPDPQMRPHGQHGSANTGYCLHRSGADHLSAGNRLVIR